MNEEFYAVKKLQKRENDLWDKLHASKATIKQQRIISDLIEVNRELEKHCNQ